jgi:predicted solute-binding protein
LCSSTFVIDADFAQFALDIDATTRMTKTIGTAEKTRRAIFVSLAFTTAAALHKQRQAQKQANMQYSAEPPAILNTTMHNGYKITKHRFEYHRHQYIS